MFPAPAVSLPIIFIYNIIRFNFIPNIIILILHFLFKNFITTFSDHFYFIFTNEQTKYNMGKTAFLVLKKS